MKHRFEFTVVEGVQYNNEPINEPTFFKNGDLFVLPLPDGSVQTWGMPFSFFVLTTRVEEAAADKLQPLPPVSNTLNIDDAVRLISVIRCAPDKFGEVK